MVKGTAEEIESTHLPGCEKYSTECRRCGMLMNGCGERADHNCIDRLKGTLVKVARICSAEGYHIRAALIPIASGGYEPEPDLDDVVEFSRRVFEKEIRDNAAILDALPPAVTLIPGASTAAAAVAPVPAALAPVPAEVEPVPAAVAPVPASVAAVAPVPGVSILAAFAQAHAAVARLPDSPPSPGPDASVMFTGTTGYTRHVATPNYVWTPPDYRITSLGLVVVNHTAPHTQATLVHRPILTAFRRLPL